MCHLMHVLCKIDMQKDAAANFDETQAFPQDDPCSQASLEDLCRSHLVKKNISLCLCKLV